MKPQTIKSTLFRYTLGALLSVLILSVLSIYVLEQYRYRQALNDVAEKMVTRAQATAESLVGPMLLDEERPAIEKILDRARVDESLTFARVISGADAIGERDNHCTESTTGIVECIDFSSGKVRVYAKIKAGEDTIGVLEKVRVAESLEGGRLERGPLYFLLLVIALVGLGWATRIFFFVENDIRMPLQRLEQLLAQQKTNLKRIPFRIHEVEEITMKLETLFEDLKNKEVDAALGELSAKVAHDLRGPLSLLNVLTENRDHAFTPEEIRLIRMSVLKVEQISSSLLEQFKAEKNINIFQSWDQLLLDLLEDQTLRGQKRGYRFQLHVDDSAKKLMPIGQLEVWHRHFLNLCENAKKAEANQIAIDIYSVEDGKVIIVVKDNGIGITDTRRSLLGKRKGSLSQGNGFGFAELNKFVELMGGQIEIQTEKSRGTEVRIKVAAISKSLDSQIQESIAADS